MSVGISVKLGFSRCAKHQSEGAPEQGAEEDTGVKVRRKWHNSIMRSFMICAVHCMLLRGPNIVGSDEQDICNMYVVYG